MPSYSTPPGLRMLYDRDGTYVAQINGGVLTALTTTEMQRMNDESISNSYAMGSSSTYLVFVFPELRDIVGVFMASGNGGIWTTVETSADTTNGQDGTWTSRTVTGTWQVANNGAILPGYRTLIGSVASATSVKGVRFSNSGNTSNYAPNTTHIYGKRSAATDTLEWWDPTSDVIAPASVFDFGDPAQGTNTVVQVRLKNRSTTLTANSITIADAALTDFSPSVPPQYTFSTDGTTYGTTATISSLAANTISGTLYIKRTTPSNAALGLHALQVSATASSWT